jgi:DNA-binding MarR family transcriptional regulator
MSNSFASRGRLRVSVDKPRLLEDYVISELVLGYRVLRHLGDRELNTLGLRTGQEMILLHLGTEEGLSQGLLAARLGVKQATISIMTRRLEKGRLVERRRDEADGRVTKVYLTGEGKAMATAVLKEWRKMERQALAGLTKPEREALQRLLFRLRGNLEERRKVDGGANESESGQSRDYVSRAKSRKG